MKIAQLRDFATNNKCFNKLDDYIQFCHKYLSYISETKNVQAKIVAQNEHQYFFIQYNKDGNYQITRPINSELFIDISAFELNMGLFRDIIKNYPEVDATNDARLCLNKMLYTIQQCLGATLDSLPVGESNKARKINGTLFERLIVQFFNALSISANPEVLDLPVVHNNEVLFHMKYQHDLVIRNVAGDVKVIGAIKTTSKDRIDKVFIDKLLYSRLTSTDIYHIAVILNDVQRKKTNDLGRFGIGSTFLPGRFKGYMVKLCPLDGVYYFDIRKAMQTDPQLKVMIQTFDKLVFDDMGNKFR